MYGLMDDLLASRARMTVKKLITCALILAGGVLMAKYVSPWLAFKLAEWICSIYAYFGI